MADQNVWFSPGSFYGGQQDWSTTPFTLDFVDPQVPQGVFLSYLSGQGLGGYGRQSQFAQSLYGRTQTGYQAAERNNPGLTYLNYLNQQFGDNGFQNLYAGLTPEQRGESGVARNFQGRARMLGRG